MKGYQTVPDLQQKRLFAATQLANAIDLATPYDAPATNAHHLLPAIHAIAQYAIALSVDQIEDITRTLMQKHAAHPIIPNQTPDQTKP